MNEPATKHEIVQQQPERMPAQGGSLTPMDMIDRALANGAGMEVMEKLMALQERWEASQGRKAFDAAIAEARSEIPVIGRTGEVDYVNNKGQRTHFKHETLPGIARIIDPILSKHGLSYRYRTEQREGQVFVTCIIAHRDGHSEETTLGGAPDQSGSKNNYQAVGSSVTYLQRYTLKAALGLAAAEDDDGKAAGASTTISEEQFRTLRDLLDKLPEDTQRRFLAACQIDMLEDLPSRKFKEAKEKLEGKVKEAGHA